jgi:hypothetical protein
MKYSLRPVRLFVMAACVSQALVFNVFAQDQATPPATGQPHATPRIVVGADGKRYRIETRTQPITEFMRFAEFTDKIGWEDLQFKAETEQGKNPVMPKANYSQLMRIREDEEQDMRNIFLGAFYQVRENDKQSGEYVQELRRKYSAELEAKMNELDMRRPKIYEEAIAKLKQQLGEETFKKIDAYVIQLEGKTRTETVVGPANASSSSQPGSNPDNGKAPQVHP